MSVMLDPTEKTFECESCRNPAGCIGGYCKRAEGRRQESLYIRLFKLLELVGYFRRAVLV
jgi:hypothetical protein